MMSSTPESERRHRRLVVAGLLAMTIGALGTILTFAFGGAVLGFVRTGLLVLLPLVVLGGLGAMAIGLQPFMQTTGDQRSENTRQFDRFLAGSSLGLFLVAVLLLSGLSTMLMAGRLDDIVARYGFSGSGGLDGMSLGTSLLIAALLATSGSVFFVVYRLHEKRDVNEPFIVARYWSGLFFRAGQSIFYVIAVFLAILTFGPTGAGTGPTAGSGQGQVFDPSLHPMQLLPLAGLIVGMFVRAAEELVRGLAERVLAAVSALVAPPANDRRGRV